MSTCPNCGSRVKVHEREQRGLLHRRTWCPRCRSTRRTFTPSIRDQEKAKEQDGAFLASRLVEGKTKPAVPVRESYKCPGVYLPTGVDVRPPATRRQVEREWVCGVRLPSGPLVTFQIVHPPPRVSPGHRVSLSAVIRLIEWDGTPVDSAHFDYNDLLWTDYEALRKAWQRAVESMQPREGHLASRAPRESDRYAPLEPGRARSVRDSPKAPRGPSSLVSKEQDPDVASPPPNKRSSPKHATFLTACDTAVLPSGDRVHYHLVLYRVDPGPETPFYDRVRVLHVNGEPMGSSCDGLRLPTADREALLDRWREAQALFKKEQGEWDRRERGLLDLDNEVQKLERGRLPHQRSR